jgi:hypothetical protein
VVARRTRKQGGQPSAEVGEGRAQTKENIVQSHMHSTQSGKRMSQRPEAAWRGKTRDLHLPGLYSFLWAAPTFPVLDTLIAKASAKNKSDDDKFIAAHRNLLNFGWAVIPRIRCLLLSGLRSRVRFQQ